MTPPSLEQLRSGVLAELDQSPLDAADFGATGVATNCEVLCQRVMSAPLRR
jgi:hypothetical protein